MLKEMSIQNFAIIDKMQIKFNTGITVITGETGAGKSILIDALSILLGDRASGEFIRQGKDSFIINAVFDIKDNLELKNFLIEKNIDIEDELFLSRSFNIAGKTNVLINGQSMPLKILRELGVFLADIHGQYANQALLNKSTHHELIDGYNATISTAYSNCLNAYKVYKKIKAELKQSVDESLERAREMDILQYQIEDITSAQLIIGEDEKIAEEIKRFDNFERLNNVCRGAYNTIQNGKQPIIDILNQIRIDIKDLVKYDEALNELSELFNGVYFQLDESTHILSNYIDGISYDEERYKFCQERDSLLYNLKKKYGETIADVISFGEKAQERLEYLEKINNNKAQLELALAKAIENLDLKLLELQKQRSIVNVEISNKLKLVLNDLGLEKAQIKFLIENSENYNSLGADNIELVFAPNIGEGFKPLVKIASGGELSRIALALSTVVEKFKNHLIVFDEIDVGISGEIAIKVAEKIKNISNFEQVICITHMPQTVAIADQHYHLTKTEVDNRTVSSLKVFNSDEHLKYMAQMISGQNESEAAIVAAQDLIKYFNGRM